MSETAEVLEAVRRWIIKAENDLKNAEHTLEIEDECPFDTVCFHAQQCAEKYLKALLTLRQIPFPKSHSLPKLLALIGSDTPLKLAESELTDLMPFAVQIRYPDDWIPVTREEATHFVEIARKVRLEVRVHLPQEVS